MKKGRVITTGIILIACLFLLPKAIKYISYKKSVGVVTQIGSSVFAGLKGQHATVQYPIILYSTPEFGNIYYRKTNEVLFGVPSVGDKIIVIYNPKDKEEAYLNRFGSFWFALPDAMLFGILCILLIGIVNIVFVKPRLKSKT